MLQVVEQFFPVLLAGFLVNLEIGLGAVVIGVLFGVPLSLLRRGVPSMQKPVSLCIRLMQALPTYVGMFFMLNWLPRDLVLFGLPITGLIAVTLAQAVYLTAYVAEDATEAFRHVDQDERERALLFFPNLLRGFVVVVMSSGFGAAVGVPEAVSATLRQAERLSAVGDRVLLFAVAIAFFAVIVGSLNALGKLLVKRVIGRMIQAGKP